MDASARRTFRPAVLPTLATIAAIALFVTAGFWQRDRMEQKQALRMQLDAAAARTPGPIPTPNDWTDWRFVPVTAIGSFDAKHQILLDNRVHDGRAGYHVITPLGLADGRVVLVNRGWIAAGATHADTPTASPPAGTVAVRGRINNPPSKYLELRHETPTGPVWQNLDLAQYAANTGLLVLPVIVEQTAPTDAADTLVRDWPAPDLGVERHWSYMIQWFTFAAMAAGLWLYFTLRAK